VPSFIVISLTVATSNNYEFSTVAVSYCSQLSLTQLSSICDSLKEMCLVSDAAIYCLLYIHDITKQAVVQDMLDKSTQLPFYDGGDTG
jgi:hypothetical protein